MAYTETYDERTSGMGNAGITDAPNYLNSSYTLAEGIMGYGETSGSATWYSSENIDVDIYSLGVLSSGEYQIYINIYQWDFLNLGNGGINYLRVLNSSGEIIEDIYSTRYHATFEVLSSQTYYVVIAGAHYEDQQYSVVYEYLSEVYSNAVWGGSASHTGFLRSGETIDAAVVVSDANGNSDGIVFTAWYLNGVYQGLSDTFNLSDDHIGKTLSFRFEFCDDAGNIEQSIIYVAGAIGGAINSEAVWGGSASHTGFLRSGETIDASVRYSDANGNIDGAVSTVWYLSNAEAGTDDTFTLSDDHVGHTLSFSFEFYDDAGNLEQSPIYVVGEIDYSGAINSAAVWGGSASFTGSLRSGETIDASVMYSDANGISDVVVFTAWYLDDVYQGLGDTFTLSDDHIGQTLSFGFEFYDDAGNLEESDTYVAGEVDYGTTLFRSTTAVLPDIEHVVNLMLLGSDNINGTGNSNNNTITGNSGNNRLNGVTGRDTLIGGSGNDTYVTDGGDTITERSNAGTDTVQSSATATLGSNVENLTLTGSAAINGTGNSLNNTLTGNSAANTLNGSTGNDTLAGGTGDDIYVTDGNDTITEASNAGTDTVQTSATATLGSNVENLALTGSAASNGTGNNLNNYISGNSGNNILNGGIGKDVLTGAAGNDTFIFNNVVESAITENTSDVITDFVIGKDKINLSSIDAFASSSANDTFVWKGTSAFNSTSKGEVRFEKFDNRGSTNDYTMVWIDNDRDNDVEMAIRLTGLHNLTASDFIL